MLNQPFSVISVDDALIHYTLQGTGSICLVFVHGAFGNRMHWQAQIEHLSPKYTIVAIDLAGHGDSSAGKRKAFTMQRFGCDVQAVVDQLGLEQVVLVGHSLGGAVILEAAHIMPKRVLGLVGVDTFIFGPYQKVEEKHVQSTMKNYQDDFTNLVYQLYRSNFHPETNSDLAEWVSIEAGRTSPHVGVSELGELLRWHVGDSIQGIRSSVQCICSKWTFENNETHLYPDFFEIQFMPDVGHFVMLEDPHTFNRLLEELLEYL